MVHATLRSECAEPQGEARRIAEHDVEDQPDNKKLYQANHRDCHAATFYIRTVLKQTSKRERDRRRQRALRARRRAGKVSYRVVLPEGPIITALLDTGRLNEVEALHSTVVEAALASILLEWAQRWHELAAEKALLRPVS